MAVRKRPASKPAAPIKQLVPEWMDMIVKASNEASMVVHSTLSRRPTSTKFWISGGNAFDLARDPVCGDVLLRVGADVSYLAALDLATLAGMLTAAATIQAAFEAEQDEPHDTGEQL